MMMNQAGSLKSNFGSVSPGHSTGPLGGMDRTPLTPMSMALANQQQTGAGTSAPANSISLSLLIDFIVQRTYHELTILAELLPRKTDMERKQEIFNFAGRTRLLAVRLLALVKWASSAAKVDKSVHIMNFLEKQSVLFVDTADTLSRMARETLVHARLPNFHIPAAVEVLTTGSYNRLPTCIRERIVPPDPITPAEKKATLAKLSQVIQHRLVTSDLPVQMRNLKVEQGRVVFTVDHEFQVSLTVLGDSPQIPWKIIEVELLVEDRDIGDGMPLVHPLQSGFILQLAQSRMDMSSNPLKELYSILHAFAQTLQLEVLYSQALKLCRERLGDYLTIEEYTLGKELILGYWKELSALDPRAELGYRIVIAVNVGDPDQPLGVNHQPALAPDEAVHAEGLKAIQIEKILVHTVYLRSRNRLSELRKEIELILGTECTLQGSPPVLSIPILTPCLRSEHLLVTVNINTGSYIVHVPQFHDPSPPVISEIQSTINTMNMKISKLTLLISQLRYWITEKRCEKTIQRLPASAGERITLIKWEEHPILKEIGEHRLIIKFQKHPYALLIVEFKEKADCPTEMDYFFYLILVKKASAEENEDLPAAATSVGTIPKFYLRPIAVLPLDTFVATHGPFTDVDVLDPSERILGKRKLTTGVNLLGQKPGDTSFGKKQKNPAYFVPELAHIVALCDERLPFALLATEFTKREIIHGGCRVEAQGVCLSIPIFQFPTFYSTSDLPKGILEGLNERLESATVRHQMQPKGSRTWNVEFKFSSNLKTMGRSIPKLENPVLYTYDMVLASDDHIIKVVNNIQDEWAVIAKLYVLMVQSQWLRRQEMTGAIFVKSYTWNKIAIHYGPNRSAFVEVVYSKVEKRFRLHFGGMTSHNPHTLIRSQLEKLLNASNPCSLDCLMKILNETYEPLFSLSKLPTTPQLGGISNRPQIPVATFVLIPQSPTHIRVVYMNTYCLDIHIQPEGLISIRDGAYSLFDKSVAMGEFFPMQIPKAFLMKYVDENAVFRRRSQSEDDNPPSPVSTLMVDMELSVGTPGSTGFLSAKPQSPAAGRSNPLTPASPHLQSNTAMGFSPAGAGGPSFANLASPPPPMSHLSQPSPNPLLSHHPAPSPSSSMLPAPSPSGGPLSVPTPSPNPGGSIGPSNVSAGGGTPSAGVGTSGMPSLPSGHPSPFFHGADSSPAPVHSPWAATASVGSPGMSRPSPARMEPRPVQTNRVLPQRSWAGAIPTILTQDALDLLCTPTTTVESVPGTEGQGPTRLPGIPSSPLERFLGSSYLRRQLQRIIQSEEFVKSKQLEIVDARGPGFILFRSPWMQFRLGHDISHHQTLHLKVTPAPSPDMNEQWSPDEIHLLETFFATKVVSPPFRPNGLHAYARLLSFHPKILKDCIQIIRLQLFPAIVEQHNWKWHVQLCLTIPHSSMPIVPQGMPAIVTSATKILIYLYLTRVGYSGQTGDMHQDAERTSFVVIPLIYESATNITQLAEKRAVGPGIVPVEYGAISQQLRRFTEMNPTSGASDRCSIFPAVQDLLANLTLPSETPQGHIPNVSGPSGVAPQMPPGHMGRPPGQHFGTGQPGMGMMQ